MKHLQLNEIRAYIIQQREADIQNGDFNINDYSTSERYVNTLVNVINDSLEEMGRKAFYDIRHGIAKDVSIILYSSGNIELHWHNNIEYFNLKQYIVQEQSGNYSFEVFGSDDKEEAINYVVEAVEAMLIDSDLTDEEIEEEKTHQYSYFAITDINCGYIGA